MRSKLSWRSVLSSAAFHGLNCVTIEPPSLVAFRTCAPVGHSMYCPRSGGARVPPPCLSTPQDDAYWELCTREHENTQTYCTPPVAATRCPGLLWHGRRMRSNRGWRLLASRCSGVRGGAHRGWFLCVRRSSTSSCRYPPLLMSPRVVAGRKGSTAWHYRFTGSGVGRGMPGGQLGRSQSFRP